MKTLEKVILGGSLALAAYAAYTLVIGLYEGVVCYQSRCAHRGSPGENFGGFILFYALIAVFGLVSAWRSNKNLKAIWATRKPPNENI
jgi:hypothetical protein